MTTANTLGIDIGSREVKIAAMNGAGLAFRATEDTIGFYIACRNGGGELDIRRLDALRKAPGYDRIVSTGYGRNNVRVGGGAVIPEIMAHAAGAVYQTGLADFTLVDMGGQDTKVIAVKDGMVDDFVMNDKCAAGSGRYLENIARVLGASLETLGKCAADPLPLSNTCAIFGESEVVGLVSEGAAVESILAGANKSVVARLMPMVVRFRPKRIVLAGGVAKNGAVRAMLEKESGVEVTVPAEPQLNGAIGCCLS